MCLALLADASPLLPARLQMALTLGFHIILACFGVGMPVMVLVAEHLGIRRGDKVWRELAMRWSKAFAVLFAVGAVSGTVLSFELGMLWPKFMGTFGAVIGLPFTMEGFAFFTEAIFAGIYLYSWNRLSPRWHWWSGVPIALSGAASAWFVVTANSWMNVPRGFELEDGVVIAADPIAAMLNPATGAQTTHMIVAAYLVSGFMVSAYYAALVLRGNQTLYVRRALGVGLTMAIIATPVQWIVGDWSAKVVADSQPVKLAAMEGLFNTERGAPLVIGGVPNEQLRETQWAVRIPKGLSLLAYGEWNAEVKGLQEFPEDHWPPVAIVHVAFQVMVGIAGLMAVLAATTAIHWIRIRRLPRARMFYWCLVWMGPLSIVALEAGWIVTEVGRQPWIVQGYMLTSEAVSDVSGVWAIFATTMIVYTVLGAGAVLVLSKLAAQPLLEDGDGA